MTDTLTKEQRSRNMSRIRSRDTGPEKAVRSILHRMGYRFSLHRVDLPGTPDVVLPKYRTVVLVHGCFWHRHRGCKKAYTPKSNVETWTDKFRKNIERDRRVEKELKKQGWKVVVVWECELRDVERLSRRLAKLISREGAE